MKKIILYILVSTFLFCAKLFAQSNIDYFPCESGNSWYYYYAYPDSGFAEQRSIVDTIVINEKTFSILQSTIHGNISEIFFRKDNMGNIWKFEEKDSSEYLWFDFTLEDSSEYEYIPFTNEYPYCIVTIKRGITLETNAGKFKNCIEFFFDVPGSYDEEQRYTFAPGIGLIRIQYASVNMLLDYAKFDGRIIKDHSHYFPMKLGNSWTYHELGIEEFKHTLFIIDSIEIENEIFYYYGPSIEYAELIQSDSLGRIWKYEDGLKKLWFDFTLAEGDSYTYTSNQWNYTVEVIRGLIEETLIGVLHDCIFFIFNDPGSIDEERYYSFAPEIGLIEESSGMGITHILESAVIDGQIISIVYDENSIISQKYFLYQNYPNPFNSETNIIFNIPSHSFTVVKIYNIKGEEIITLVNKKLEAGKYTINFKANRLPSGLYFYQLKTGEFSTARKLLLIK